MSFDISDSSAVALTEGDVDTRQLAADILGWRGFGTVVTAAGLGVGVAVAVLLQFDFLSVAALTDPLGTPGPFRSIVAYVTFWSILTVVQIFTHVVQYHFRDVVGPVTEELLEGGWSLGFDSLLSQILVLVVGLGVLLLYEYSVHAATFLVWLPLFILITSVLNSWSRLLGGSDLFTPDDALYMWVVAVGIGVIIIVVAVDQIPFAPNTFGQTPALTFFLPALLAAQPVFVWHWTQMEPLTRIGQLEAGRRRTRTGYENIEDMWRALRHREGELRDRYPGEVPHSWPSVNAVFDSAIEYESLGTYVSAADTRLHYIDQYLDLHSRAGDVPNCLTHDMDSISERGSYDDFLRMLTVKLDPARPNQPRDFRDRLEVLENALSLAEQATLETRQDATGFIADFSWLLEDESPSDEEIAELGECLSDINDDGLLSFVDQRKSLVVDIEEFESRKSDLVSRAPAGYDLTNTDTSGTDVDINTVGPREVDQLRGRLDRCNRWLDLHEAYLAVRERAITSGVVESDERLGEMTETLVRNLAPAQYDDLDRANRALETLNVAIDLYSRIDGEIDADIDRLYSSKQTEVETPGPDEGSLAAIESMLEVLEHKAEIAT